LGGKVFFASDFHLGLKAGTDPSEREKRVVKWLETVYPEASAIYLLGDVFDFWWEYRKVVPKGFTRFLGTVSKITDKGIPVHFFGGNHDMWFGNYLKEECGMILHTGPFVTTIDGRVFYLAHGEGLGTRDAGFRILLALFRSRFIRMLYSAIHPSIGVAIGHRWSQNSRLGKGISLGFLGEEKEDLFVHSADVLKKQKIDYFIYGHRHLPMTRELKAGGVITILGDWINAGIFAEWDGKQLILKQAD